MKNIIILLLMLVAFETAKAQINNCTRVHTGIFKLTSESSGITIITRTANTQTEDNEKFNVHASYDLIWLDSCTYELINPKVLKGDPIYAGKPGEIITVHIIEVKEKTFVVNTTANISKLCIEREIEIIR